MYVYYNICKYVFKYVCTYIMLEWFRLKSCAVIHIDTRILIWSYQLLCNRYYVIIMPSENLSEIYFASIDNFNFLVVDLQYYPLLNIPAVWVSWIEFTVIVRNESV